MSNSHNAALTASVAKLSADFSQFSSDLNVGLAALKAEIAAGGTPDFTAVDAATDAINTLDTGLANASAALHAATDPVVRPPLGAPPAVVFNAADTTPNSPGGRNSSHLADFDSTLPETA